MTREEAHRTQSGTVSERKCSSECDRDRAASRCGLQRSDDERGDDELFGASSSTRTSEGFARVFRTVTGGGQRLFGGEDRRNRRSGRFEERMNEPRLRARLFGVTDERRRSNRRSRGLKARGTVVEVLVRAPRRLDRVARGSRDQASLGRGRDPSGTLNRKQASDWFYEISTNGVSQSKRSGSETVRRHRLTSKSGPRAREDAVHKTVDEHLEHRRPRRALFRFIER